MSATYHLRRSVIVLAAAVCAFLLFVMGANAASAKVGTDDYPYRNASTHGLDKWDFNLRQCTSFVAWRLNNDNRIPFDDHYKGVFWGDAQRWDDVARQVGITVDQTPYVGSVAQFNTGVQGAGSAGHVAYVLQVQATQVLVEEYNRVPYGYDQHWVSRSGVNFIHFGNNAD
jgi:surface antigen